MPSPEKKNLTRKRKAAPAAIASNGSNKKNKEQSLEEKFQKDREKAAKSIMEFRFIKRRARLLTEAQLTKEGCSGIAYWMSRDGRVQDNWAMLFAQKLAIKNQVPLHVVFCLLPKFLDATLRHYKFLLRGLEEVSEQCSMLNIQFHILRGQEAIVEFVEQQNIGGIVCDFSPMDFSEKWIEEVKKNVPENVPLVQVDAHNIVPVWVASDKVEYSARTIRKKITNNLEEFLTPFPPVIVHPYSAESPASEIDWKGLMKFLKVDKKVDEVDWAVPGYKAALAVLKEFTEHRLEKYSSQRNDPLADAQSNLSPWLHFGQISAQRCILYVNEFRNQFTESVEMFCEEAIVRRELADNFCFFSENQSTFEGLHNWARTTLDAHRKDKREYVYSRKKLDDALTHDDLWNAAQLQMKHEGKMHGFLRMYWAKKILEWTQSPEEAISTALYLNDRYSLDGRDPNGIVGILWSIGGLHDGPWMERPVYGKIRYMAMSGCKKKFNVKEFVERYGKAGQEKKTAKKK
ncbi:deoxyribodipyrimidine photo-lyase isoform X2 [Phlebotomus papatasi]|uniref:deoxyribodipyrimidine photo-lyase isoform X2 n=1 Tax=Phlebotomus papatasi TaxID=29031 RepID=UPI0024846E5B|nr:deoxyribodipyrimidine photo-lyase isoform X2 [Phlebotomus papatasi]